jgi:precorrin-2/cobalt-factor-2 C20-methyltransferase
VTLKALRILREADVVFTVLSSGGMKSVSGRIVDSLDGITAEKRELTFSMSNDWKKRKETVGKNADEILRELRTGKTCAFATIGDPLTYGTYGYILKEILKAAPETMVETVPGVNSWSALAATSNTVLAEDKERLCVVPSHSTVNPEKELDNAETVVFLKTYNTRDELSKKLTELECDVIYGANLGLENEFVSDNGGDILSRDKEYLSMLIAKKRR